MSGRLLGHYRLLDRQSDGGTGDVYRARDEQLHRIVAIRILGATASGDPSAHARLVREARAAAALNHPHISSIYQVGEAEGATFIAMELVEGEPLSGRLARGVVPVDEALRYGIQVADALAHAHDRSIVHGDLTSANVFITPEGRVKVLDFGVARPGPPAHASDDVLALGVLLNEMAPDRGPAPLRAVIARCLENDPARRYKTAGDVRAALEVVQVTHAPRLAGTSSSPRRSRRIMALAAAAVVLAAAFMTWRLWPSEPVNVRSLAILPFENLENDERIDYLADGLTESLIRQTSRLPSIRVTSLHVVLNLRGKKVDVASVGRELHAESVVTGRMKQEGSRLLITAELTEVASGTRLWERSYDLAATDLLEAQDEIAAAILNDGLRMRLNDADRRRLVSHLTNNAEAYDLYLHAAYISRHPNEGAYENTLRMLTRAIELDPKFAEAYSEIAAIHAVMVTDGFERPSVGWPLVNTYVRRALEIDPNQFAAMAFEHAFAFFFAWDWEGAARARRRLLQSVPSEVNPRAFLAFMLELWALGRPGEALELARRVREHDPIGADVVMLEADYLARSGQFDAAVAVYERSIAIDAENADAWFGLAEAKYNLKKFDEASAAQQQALSMLGHDAAAKAFSVARGEEGYRRAFRVWLRTQLEIQQREAVDRYVSPLDFARVYAQLGDRARAFKYLDAAFDERSAGLVFLNVDQAWNAIRDDPRFLTAVRRVGLPVDKGR